MFKGSQGGRYAENANSNTNGTWRVKSLPVMVASPCPSKYSG
jgi:hypothetical protein